MFRKKNVNKKTFLCVCFIEDDYSSNVHARLGKSIHFMECLLESVCFGEVFIIRDSLGICPGLIFLSVLDRCPLWKISTLGGFHCPHITSRVSQRHHFRAKKDPKRFFMEVTFLTDNNNFHVLLQPFQGIKVDSGQKFTQINDNKNRVKNTFVFSSCQGQPLGSCLSFSKSFRTTLV